MFKSRDRWDTVEVDGPRGSIITSTVDESFDPLLEDDNPIPPARGKKSPRRAISKKGTQPDTYSLKNSPTGNSKEDGHSIYSEPVHTNDDGFWESIGKSWQTVQNLQGGSLFWNSDEEDDEDEEFHSVIDSGRSSGMQELVDIETENIKFKRQQTEKSERLTKLKNKFFTRKRAKSEGSRSPAPGRQEPAEIQRSETATPRSRAYSSKGLQFSFHWKSSSPPPPPTTTQDEDTQSVLSFIARYSDNKDHHLYYNPPPDTQPVPEAMEEDSPEHSGFIGSIWPVGKHDVIVKEESQHSDSIKTPTTDSGSKDKDNIIFSHSDFLNRYNKNHTEPKTQDSYFESELKKMDDEEEEDADTVVDEEEGKEEETHFPLFSLFSMRKDIGKEDYVEPTEAKQDAGEVHDEEENSEVKSSEEGEEKTFFSSLPFFSRSRTKSAPSPTTNTSKILGVEDGGERKESLKKELTMIIPVNPNEEISLASRSSSIYLLDDTKEDDNIIKQEKKEIEEQNDKSLNVDKDEFDVPKSDERSKKQSKFSLLDLFRSKSASSAENEVNADDPDNKGTMDEVKVSGNDEMEDETENKLVVTGAYPNEVLVEIREKEGVVSKENNDDINEVEDEKPSEPSKEKIGTETLGLFARFFKKDHDTTEGREPTPNIEIIDVEREESNKCTMDEVKISKNDEIGDETENNPVVIGAYPDEVLVEIREKEDVVSKENNDESNEAEDEKPSEPSKEKTGTETLGLFARFFKKDPDITEGTKSTPDIEIADAEGDAANQVILVEEIKSKKLNIDKLSPSPPKNSILSFSSVKEEEKGSEKNDETPKSETKSDTIVQLDDPVIERNAKNQNNLGILSMWFGRSSDGETSEDADDERSVSKTPRAESVKSKSAESITEVQVHTLEADKGVDQEDTNVVDGRVEINAVRNTRETNEHVNDVKIEEPINNLSDQKGDKTEPTETTTTTLDIPATPYNSENKETWFKVNQIDDVKAAKKEANYEAEKQAKKKALDKEEANDKNEDEDVSESTAENEYKPKKQEEKLVNAVSKQNTGMNDEKPKAEANDENKDMIKDMKELESHTIEDLETTKSKVEGSITEADLKETARLFGIDRMLKMLAGSNTGSEVGIENSSTIDDKTPIDPLTQTEPISSNFICGPHFTDKTSETDDATLDDDKPFITSFLPSFMTKSSKANDEEDEDEDQESHGLFSSFINKTKDKQHTAESTKVEAKKEEIEEDVIEGAEMVQKTNQPGENIGIDSDDDDEEVQAIIHELDLSGMFGSAKANVLKLEQIADEKTNELKNGINEALRPKNMSWWKKIIWMYGMWKVKKKKRQLMKQMGMKKEKKKEKKKKKISLSLTSCFRSKKKRSSTSSQASSSPKQTVSDGSKGVRSKKSRAFPGFKRKEKRPPTFINNPNMGKDKNIITTTEQLEEFLQQRNDIILDELKTILQQSSRNTDNKISTLKLEVEGALKLREKELRRLRRETEESFRTCERLLHALTFQRKMLEAVLKIRDREIQNLRRCVGIQKRLIVKTLNVIVADGVVEMTPKQRGDLLKLVQEMGDIDINSSEGVGFSEETVLQEYREALIRSEGENTGNIDSVIQERRNEKNANLEQRKTRIEAPIGDFFTRTTNVGRDASTRGGESESDEDYIPLDIAPILPSNPPTTNQTPEPKKGLLNSISVGKIKSGQSKEAKPFGETIDPVVAKQPVPRQVLFECGKLLGSAWVSFAISQRIGFTLEDVSVLRKRYNTDEERAKAMLLIWLEQSGEGTYGNLYSALDDIGRRDIVKKLQEMSTK